MTDSKDFLTTQAFAEKAGISKSTVSKWLRDGKIKGKKVGKKWMIPSDQLTNTKKSASKAPAPAKKTSTASGALAEKAIRTGGRTYTVKEFSEMTYLTEFGVEKWLREGRLKGTKDGTGIWTIDTGNLDIPDVQRLLRK